MSRVTGIGGVFFRANDPKALTAWYQNTLGVEINAWGSSVFRWSDDPGHLKAATAWRIAGKDSDLFHATEANFIINYRVDDAKGVVENVRKSGAKVVKEPYDDEFGVFATVLDPEGNQIELWEPKRN